MAKSYICDICDKREQPDGSYDVPPVGWYAISRRTKVSPWLSAHFCSPECLTTFAEKQVAEQVAVPEVVHVG